MPKPFWPYEAQTLEKLGAVSNKPISLKERPQLVMAKKKKRARAESESQPELDADNVNKPEPQNEVELVHEAKKKKKKKKQNNKADSDEAKLIPTVSIAVPGSIIDNAQSLELATRVPLSL